MDYGLKLKLIVDSKKNKVVFAEADKAFVDMLFKLLKLSIGSFLHLLQKNEIEMIGCLANLFNTLATSNHLIDLIYAQHIFTVSSAETTGLRSFCPIRPEYGHRESFVKDSLYVVTDDLKVIQNTYSNCMSLFRDSSVCDTRLSEEKIVDVPMEKVLALLKTSFKSSTVLTDVFLAKEEISVKTEPLNNLSI